MGSNNQKWITHLGFEGEEVLSLQLCLPHLSKDILNKAGVTLIEFCIMHNVITLLVCKLHGS